MPLYLAMMHFTATVDSAGRIVIPKPLRDELRLSSGDTLALESDGDILRLRPIRSVSALRKEKGVWVFRSGQKIPAAETDRALEIARQTRDREVLGSPE